MKIFYHVIQFLLICSFTYAQTDGELDSTFGVNGVCLSNFTNGALGKTAQAIDQHQNITIAGTNENAFAIVKMNNQGIIDTTFSNHGTFRYFFGFDNNYCNSIIIQPDDKIVLGGYSVNTSPFGGGQSQTTLIRLHSNGSIDSTFGNGGRFEYNPTPNVCGAAAIAMQSDGKIIMVGKYSTISSSQIFALRVNANGNLDLSYGNNGISIIQADSVSNADEVTCCCILPNNYLLVGFCSGIQSLGYGVFGMAQLRPDGSININFGNNGFVKSNIDLIKNDIPKAIKIQNDLKIILAGSAANSKKMALCRYNPNGIIDSTFNENGIDTLDISAGNDVINDFCFLEDGKILAVGQSNGKACVIRLLSNGKIDSTFNNSGVLTYNNSNGEVFINATLATSTKLLAGGLLKDANQKTQLAVAAYDFSLFSGVPSIYQNSQMDVYPNPTHDVINLTAEILDSENIIIDIFDLSGRNIQQINKGQLAKGKHYFQIDLQDYQSGLYFLKVSNDNRTLLNKKFIKI